MKAKSIVRILAMKLISLLSRAATFSGVAFVLGLALGAPASFLFTITVSAAILLITFYDYAPRLKTAPLAMPTRSRRRRYTLPLAA